MKVADLRRQLKVQAAAAVQMARHTDGQARAAADDSKVCVCCNTVAGLLFCSRQQGFRRHIWGTLASPGVRERALQTLSGFEWQNVAKTILLGASRFETFKKRITQSRMLLPTDTILTPPGNPVPEFEGSQQSVDVPNL